MSFSQGENKKADRNDQLIRAAEEIRTPTVFRPLPPQSSASTSFATAAMGGKFKQ